MVILEYEFRLFEFRVYRFFYSVWSEVVILRIVIVIDNSNNKNNDNCMFVVMYFLKGINYDFLELVYL